jgi:hypothetical protein
MSNRKSTSQNGVNNKIHIACSDLYRKFFPSSNSLESLPQYRQIPLESSGKVVA